MLEDVLHDGENGRFARRHPDPLAGAVILQSRRAEKSWIIGFMFWLGISKTLAGPMDLHIFVVLDELRFLGVFMRRSPDPLAGAMILQTPITLNTPKNPKTP